MKTIALAKINFKKNKTNPNLLLKTNFQNKHLKCHFENLKTVRFQVRLKLIF